MKIRSDIYKEVQTGLNAGKRKEQIYNELKDNHPAASVERSLAQWPYPADKEKNRFLNIPLLIIVIVFALEKILHIAAVFQTLEPGQIAAAGLTVLIHLYIIYGVKNYNLIGYLLVLLMAATTLLSTRSLGAGNMLALALSAAALALAWIQKTRLFPNVSLLLKHKKDSNGNIIF